MMITISSVTQRGSSPAPPTMDHLTERILHLTLEILCLLTGESLPCVKSGDHVMIEVSPLSSVIINRSHKQKILEVTNRIIELLAGETGKWSACHILGPEEIKEEDAGMEEMVYLEGARELKETMMEDGPVDGSSDGPLPEISPQPPYPSDAAQEDQLSPTHDQDNEVIAIKVEVIDEEEGYAWTDQQDAMKGKAGVIPTTGTIPSRTIRDRRRVTRRSYGGNPICQNTYPGLRSGDASLDLAKPKESSEKSQSKMKTKRSEYIKYERVHEGEKSFQGLEDEKPHACSHCGRRFNKKANLLRHCLLHTGEKPLTCPDCGKSFARKSNLIDHQRTHTGEKPFPCSECNKSFTQKSNLIRHQRTHRDERIIICSECGKYFTHEAFVIHQSIHRGEEPFPCYECGQRFTQKSDLLAHQRYHAGEQTGLS